MSWSAVAARMRHMPLALAVSAATIGAAVIVAWVAAGAAAGAAAGVGAGLGVALVVASYTASTLAIAWADAVNPRLVFGVGMGMYVTKFSLFGLLLLAVGSSDWPGRLPMAAGITLAVVSWTATQIWWTVHNAYPYQDPGDHDANPPKPRRS